MVLMARAAIVLQCSLLFLLDVQLTSDFLIAKFEPSSDPFLQFGRVK